MTARPAGGGLRERLSNPRADRIKQVAALAGRSVSSSQPGPDAGSGSSSNSGSSSGSISGTAARAARERSGQFLVEGPQGVRELVANRADLVRDVYVSDAARLAHAAIVDAALEAGLFVHPVTDEVSAAMSRDSQGIAAVARMWDLAPVEVPAGARLVAILSDVRDPGNAGTAIRVADAAGADVVILAGESVDVFNPKVVRATAGSLFHVPVVRGVSVADAVGAARSAGLVVLAADGGGDIELPGGGSTNGANTLELAQPTAWLFGNEAHGLAAADLALADRVVRIPIYGAAESLNLATAVAVCLYASAGAHAASN